MRALILALTLSACVGTAPEPPEYQATYIIATCADFAEIFCTRASVCFPELPGDWCTRQEYELCMESNWPISETCLDTVDALECSESSLAIPCECNPDQDICEAP